MISRNIFLVLMALVLLHCKPIGFNEKTAKSSLTAVDDSEPAPDQDDGVALEPVPIAGAYLACFLDPQMAVESGVAVGCQTFNNTDMQKVNTDPGITIVKSEVRGAASRVPLQLIQLDKHPRWRWVTSIPNEALPGTLVFDIRDASGQLYKMQVELLDILPAGILSNTSLQGGLYRLRIKGSDTCLSGNPVWTWDSTNTQPITEGMISTDCGEAQRFAFEVFETGMRVYTANPKPTPTACETVNFIVSLCQQSCIDLDDYGRGNRYSMFACTTSVEAQRQNFVPAAKGSIRLRTNGRFMTFTGNKAVPLIDGGVEFEVIPVAR